MRFRVETQRSIEDENAGQSMLKVRLLIDNGELIETKNRAN